MALRCKGGANNTASDGAEVLNFPRSDYDSLLPIIDRLSRVSRSQLFELSQLPAQTATPLPIADCLSL